MKWIGQHIYDLVARFRSDIYLEKDTYLSGISTSTETDMLVVDSNNKISKRAIDAITVDVSDFMTNGVDNRILTATGADAMNAEANLTFNGTTLTLANGGTFASGGNVTVAPGEESTNTSLAISNAVADQKALDIVAENTTVDVLEITADSVTTANVIDISCDALTTGSALNIEDDSSVTGVGGARSLVKINQKNTAAAAAKALEVVSNGGSDVAFIDANASGDTGQNKRALVVDLDRTVPSSGTSAHNDTGIEVQVNSASLGTSSLKGMDITVVGATSGTSTAYGMDIDVSGADTNFGVYVTTRNDDAVGFQHVNTQTSSATEGGKITLSSNDNAALGDNHRLGVLQFNAYDGAGGITGARIQAMADAAWSGTVNDTRLEFYTMDGDNTSELSLTLDSDLLATFAGAVTVTGALTGTLATAAQTNITSLGTLTALDVDDINLNTKTITITGDTSDTFAITTGAAGATTMTTTDAGGTAGHFEVAADGNITLDAAGDIALEAGGDDITLDSDTLVITSATSQRPRVDLIDTANDADGSRFRLIKNRGAAGQDDDLISAFQFQGYNDAGSPELNTFGQIFSSITDATDGQESGSMTLQVAAHGGGLENGLVVKGGSQDDEVDVDIGLGTASVTTVAGDLNLGGSLKKRLHYVHADIKDTGSDMTDEYFLSLGDAERESTNALSVAIPIIIPADGVLKRVIKRSQSNLSGKAWSYKLKKVPSGTALGSNTLVATVTKNAGGGANTNSIIDFTTDASDAANACTFESGFSAGATQFSAGDSILFSYQCTSGSGPGGTPKIVWTLVFELDDSTAY